MAIYWIDPSTIINGTGTYSSPWSLSSSSRPAFISGDEIRIKSANLVNVLTQTQYVASYNTTTSQHNTMTINSGGNLGNDFSVYDLIYLPATNAIFKIVSIEQNSLSIASDCTIPWYNTSPNQNSIDLRKINLNFYGISTSGTSYNIFANNEIGDIKISDGWVTETNRITDGSAISIFNSSSALSINFNDCLTASFPGSSNVNFDLKNTYMIPGNGLNSGINANFKFSNSIYKIAQVFTNSLTPCITIGSPLVPTNNTTIEIDHVNCYYLFNSPIYGKSLKLNIKNISKRFPDYLDAGSGSTLFYAENSNLSFGNTVSISGAGTTSIIWGGAVEDNTVINLSGTIDIVGQASAPISVYNGLGNVKINFSENFSYYKNRRDGVNINAVGRKIVFTPPATTTVAIYGNKNVLPDANNIAIPTGWSSGSSVFINNVLPSTGSFYNSEYKKPYVTTFISPTSLASIATEPNGYRGRSVNVLLIGRDGSFVKEILAINGGQSSLTTTDTPSRFPSVQRDSVTYRSSGPSFKSSLTTYVSNYWIGNPKSIKNILIPINNGFQYSIVGYIRCDNALYTNGDCNISIVFRGIELDNYQITTSCINSWEEFTLSFTAPNTGEAYLVWEMNYFSGNMSYWLDDLSINIL